LAVQQVKGAPEPVGGLAVIDVPFGGDLGWTVKEWAIYSPQMLNRHAVIIGGSGTDKTEFLCLQERDRCITGLQISRLGLLLASGALLSIDTEHIRLEETQPDGKEVSAQT
jgi:hypothetical protein